jgi:hypothetical protein
MKSKSAGGDRIFRYVATASVLALFQKHGGQGDHAPALRVAFVYRSATVLLAKHFRHLVLSQSSTGLLSFCDFLCCLLRCLVFKKEEEEDMNDVKEIISRF